MASHTHDPVPHVEYQQFTAGGCGVGSGKEESVGQEVRHVASVAQSARLFHVLSDYGKQTVGLAEPAVWLFSRPNGRHV